MSPNEIEKLKLGNILPVGAEHWRTAGWIKARLNSINYDGNEITYKANCVSEVIQSAERPVRFRSERRLVEETRKEKNCEPKVK